VVARPRVNDPGAILANPVTALMAAVLCVLSIRFFVAWSVLGRVRGPWVGGVYGANLHPHRARSDYPRPNDPLREGAILVTAAILIIPAIGLWLFVATLGPPEQGDVAPSWVGPAIFFGAAIVSVIYAVRRIREDDRRQRRILGERLAAESSERLKRLS
jgi:hypothetical protein